MSEIEVPMEGVQEHIEHAAHHGVHGEGKKNWVTWAALFSALLAVMAAVAALKAGHLADEGMIDQIKASDTWGFYQAKSIKANILETRSQILLGLGKDPGSQVEDKLAEYAREQKDLQAEAKEHQDASARSFYRHSIFSTAVTLFQIAIAITAIAVLARRRRFLIVAACFGVFGIYHALRGFLSL